MPCKNSGSLCSSRAKAWASLAERPPTSLMLQLRLAIELPYKDTRKNRGCERAFLIEGFDGVLAWREALAEVQEHLGRLFVRPEPRRQASRYLEGLLSPAQRKNGWQLAEQIGDSRPWRTQRVLSQVLWDEDAARDLCRSYVIEHSGSSDAVLVIDETGFLNKGTKSVGVAR